MIALEDKVALVTGGAVRVGREIALALARQGCDIVVHFRESAPEAEMLAEDIRQMGRQAWLVCGDLSNPYSPEVVMRTAWELAGWVDILVNNASIFSHLALEIATVDEIEEMWRVNALAPMMLAKTMAELAEASEILPEDYCGRVINLLDRRIVKADTGRFVYWMSKKCLEAFTLGGALELAPRITVNGVAPGPVLAPDDSDVSEFAGSLPLAVRCLPSDVADAVIYLCGAMTVTGQIIYVDSGQHLL